MAEEGFVFDIQSFHAEAHPTLSTETARNTISSNGLGTLNSIYNIPFAGEWGVTFLHQRGQIDGAGNQIIEDPYDTPPATRQEAVRRMFEFLKQQYNLNETNRPWTSMNGIYPWQHYAGEMGFDRIGVEIGEAVSSYQSKIAFTRGAARQYGKSWFVDFSSWHQGWTLDYSDYGYWGAASGINNGHSLSLLERSFFLAYMSGSNGFIGEAGSLLSFYNELDSNGNYKLTPYGELMKKCAEFTRENSDVGTTCTPFGLVLDYYHGQSGGDDGITGDANLAFGHFEYTEADIMTRNLLNMFFPNSLEVVDKNETTTMVSSPYGDTCDVLLQNASSEVLNSYPVLILSGNILFSDEEVSRYKAYAEQGGHLILNTAYLPYFAEYNSIYQSGIKTFSVGNGTVTVYGGDYDISELPSIVQKYLKRYIPFEVDGDIEYIVNVKDNHYIVTLINNAGVSKAPQEAVVIDQSQIRTVSLHFTGNKSVKSIESLRDNANIEFNDNSTTVTLSAGEVMILDWTF